MTIWDLRECEGLTARASQQQTNSAKLEDDLRAEVERMIQDTLNNFVCSISRGSLISGGQTPSKEVELEQGAYDDPLLLLLLVIMIGLRQRLIEDMVSTNNKKPPEPFLA